ncbi:hypothetical protein ACFFQW_23420 [Umezawaea endophytica]|uniref:Uncharacterized protein n=1 Tax=Umezawaea endophytica TaxID=1654476 RepID=A0A9X2VQ29_9PSEU|nr:hypothetical protein [Umezawaea endophytica]MCS7480783.1 hypothetical protein [Umezawaea endophytica]
MTTCAVPAGAVVLDGRTPPTMVVRLMPVVGGVITIERGSAH